MKKMSAYFSHDADAASDEKLSTLISVYDYQGYGWYWRIVEMMRKQSGFSLTITKHFYKTLAETLRTDEVKIKKFIKDCIEEFVNGDGNGLFLSDGKKIWSESLNLRMEMMGDVSKMRSEFGILGAKIRWQNHQKDTKPSENLNENGKNSISYKNGISHSKSSMAKCKKKRKEKKRKESKRKENKEKKIDIISTENSKGITAECNFAFETWNNQTNVVHARQILPSHQKRYDKCVERLGKGDEAHNQILLAIRNYGTILASPDKYYFHYRWTFEEFLTREKSTLMFGIPLEICLQNFTKYGKVTKGFVKPDPPMARKPSLCIDCGKKTEGTVLCVNCTERRRKADESQMLEYERLKNLSAKEIQDEITRSLQA